MTKTIEIREFAERVERFCDFFLSKTEKDGSKDVLVVQTLKNDAADIQFNRVEVTDSKTLHGLHDYMNGV